MNSTKLEGDLQPILGSLGQFLLTNIKISKFSDYNLNLLKFARILVKKKIVLVSVWDLTIPKILQTRNPIVGNIESCFCHHYKRHFISFKSIWYHLKMRSSMFTSSFTSSLVLAICSNISKPQSSSTPMLTKTFSDSTKGCKW
jgi:hypothetical protein